MRDKHRHWLSLAMLLLLAAHGKAARPLLSHDHGPPPPPPINIEELLSLEVMEPPNGGQAERATLVVTVKLKDLFPDEGPGPIPSISHGRRLAQTSSKRSVEGVRGIDEWLDGASPSDKASFSALSGSSRQDAVSVQPSPPLTLSALSGRRLLVGGATGGQGTKRATPAEEPIVGALDSSSKKSALDSWAASTTPANKQSLEAIGALSGSSKPTGVKIAELGLDRGA